MEKIPSFGIFLCQIIFSSSNGFCCCCKTIQRPDLFEFFSLDILDKGLILTFLNVCQIVFTLRRLAIVRLMCPFIECLVVWLTDGIDGVRKNKFRNVHLFKKKMIKDIKNIFMEHLPLKITFMFNYYI